MLTDNSRSASFSELNINPGEYLAITTSTGASEFSQSSIISLSNFPSLSNAGEQLQLFYKDALIFSVSYSDDWHSSDQNRVGGVSLEMKDVTNPCGGSENWTSSTAANRGTPGFENSVTEAIPDSFAPQLIDAIAVAEDTVLLEFSEQLDPTIVSQIDLSFEPSALVAKVIAKPSFTTSLFIVLSEPLTPSIRYTVKISAVDDCNGNSSESSSLSFALPITSTEDEIKLSEVLFNPRSNGVDFVEVFNDSENFISLKNWKLASLNDVGDVDNEKPISATELVIDPGQYLVFTIDRSLLLTNYPKGESENFVQLASLPGYPNAEGTVVLINQNDEIVETFNYSDDYHYQLLESVDGVSLERVSFEQPNNGDNWRSAASTEGFATPGYANSQSLELAAQSGTVSANPEVFIPGNAGTGRDFTTINYELSNAGQFANINVYDQNGRLVKNLAQGILLSTSGFIRWDGDTNQGQIARMGYYLIIFEIYDGNGNSNFIKETVVVGRDF
ncbi:MAG: lamin tail domain-containing protein [Ekhidna sp.]|nr:lamin tail domain-containing protein [Ekhidna sp.]